MGINIYYLLVSYNLNATMHLISHALLIMINSDEPGWILMYIFAFGISDLFVKKVITSDSIHVLYYSCIGIIGLIILYKRQNNKESWSNIAYRNFV